MYINRTKATERTRAHSFRRLIKCTTKSATQQMELGDSWLKLNENTISIGTGRR